MTAQHPNAKAQQRRDTLLGWLCEREAHSGLTAREIVDVSGIYDGHGRYDKAVSDLHALRKLGLVDRRPGRPARWVS